MKFVEEFWVTDFSDLKNICWSGALQTLDEIEENNLEDEFMDYLEENFFDTEDNCYTTTDLNDFIWFECDDWIEEHKECDEDDE